MSDNLDFLLANRTKTLTFIGVTRHHLIVVPNKKMFINF